MDGTTDAELVSEALAGDRAAFAALVRRYQDHAYGAAIGVLADFELARDVVQEAFLAAYRDLKKCREPHCFGGWLHGIVRNLASRALRERRQVRSLAEAAGHRVATVDPSPGPDESAEDAEVRTIVLKALDRLSGRHREVIGLHYVDGLSYRDIAAFLDVSEATVQGRLQRGREALRRELKMVKDTFDKHKLPEDFSEEIGRLLDAAAQRGWEYQVAINRMVDIGAPAVDALCAALGDPRIAVRRAAAYALCKIGDTRALGPILGLIRAKDSWRHHKLFSRGRVLSIPGMREELLRILDQDEGDERWWAIHILACAAADHEIYDRLLALFRDTRQPRGLRCQALAAVCRLRKEGGAELVTEALSDPAIRRHSGWAWWTAAVNGYVLPIETCVAGFGRDVAPSARRTAGRLVLRHGDEGRTVLEDLLRTGTPDQRAAAALALAPERRADVFDALLAELLDGYQQRKWQRIVARAVMQDYADELCAWAEAEGVPAERPAVAWVLGKLRLAGGQGSDDDILHYGTPTRRMAAVRALAREKGAAFIPELRSCLREGRPRKVAQEAFWQMHRLRDAALPVVIEMLESEHWTERKAALCLLRRWRKLTPEQKERGIADEHVAVRHAADWHPGYREAAKTHPKWRRKLGAQA